MRGRSSRSYHEWPASTPVLDLLRTLVAAASVMIGGYALIFFAFALRDGNGGLALRYLLFLVGVGVANGTVAGLRRWRRHHG
jgi:hypothetical protein